MNKLFACIDLKSFYASVECVDRGLDPITTNLVVADSSRTDKTICLAVTPSLKQYGLSGRSRLYEVYQKVREINLERRNKINHDFLEKSYDDTLIQKDEKIELDFIIAPPRMKRYMKYSTDIYHIYLKYLAPEDVYVYSIDEVFCDITNYLKLYKLNALEFVGKIIKDIYITTGITATAGVGTNLYLAKVAMDIVAKHVDANEDGVRIAILDEISYRKKLWDHKPITDFWRIGRGIAKRLEDNGMYTIGDIARCSIENEDKLFKIFGINAELLIDHAWGWEPCTLLDIKKYKPHSNSLSSSQVLHKPYDFYKTRLIVKEMIELLTLDLVEKKYLTDHIVLTIGYDRSNLNSSYNGEVVMDHYGRMIPKAAHGTIRLTYHTSSTEVIRREVLKLYDEIADCSLLSKRIGIAVCNLVEEKENKKSILKQFDLFNNTENEEKKIINQIKNEEEEKRIQQAMIHLKHKYGKNCILKGMNLCDGATTIERNKQVGGHRE